MSVPSEIRGWLRSHYRDKKVMEEMQAYLIMLQVTENKGRPVTEQVREILKNSYLAEIKAGEVAQFLGMSERSLNRRLHEGNTNFKAMLDEERKQRYQAMRAEGDITLAKMAQILGFADSKSLSRAIRRWARKAAK